MKMLRKFWAVLLILVITFQGETAHIFSFIPKFISHYHHHNEEHHRVGVFQFIEEHFMGENEHYKREHRDDEHGSCPFTHSHNLVQLVYIFKKEPLLLVENVEFVNETGESELPDYRFTFSEYNGSIWQPPKI